MDAKRIQILIEKYIDGVATPEEADELTSWYRASNDQELEWLEEKDAVRLRMLANIEEQTGGARYRSIRLWPRIVAAASVFIVFGFGGYYLFHKHTVKQEIVKNDIAPGKNQATLTLANGKKIILTKSLNGLLAQQGNIHIQMGASGITYNGTGNTTIQYNTLSTARGEISPLPLVLSDGTKVWLNTASSITYPVSFATNERKVTVTGEAYFEVVHNAAKPFIVSTDNQTIQDIGTAFDVNAYADEASSKTTLVEGSIKVNSMLLKPGQQFRFANSKGNIVNADIEETLAWKNGKFRFSNEKLSEIMLQASRWYNVEVTYENETLKNKTFGVIGNRFAKASDLLHTLELTGEVKFTISGNKITITHP